MSETAAPAGVEPRWLLSIRELATAACAGLPRPVESMEEWRHTDPRSVPFDALPRQGPGPGPDVEKARAGADALGERAGLVVSGASGVALSEVPSEVAVAPLSSLDEDPGVGELVGPDRDLAVAVNSRAFVGGVLVDIPHGTRMDAPLVVVHVAESTDSLSAPRVLLRIGDEAEVSLVELYVSDGPGAGTLVVPVSEIHVGDGAAVHHAHVQHLDDTAFSVATQVTRMGRDTRYTSIAANLGARLGRLCNEVHLAGEGGELDMYGVYVGDGERHVDFRSEQAHEAPRCTSRLLYKGAVWDRSSAIYSGLVRIDPGAARSDAQQAGHYLILSEDARAAVIPNLEIHNHDVACGHAASGGPPDEDQMYYLESRGIDAEAARRLVVDGFFSDVIDRIPLAGLRAHIEAEVFRRLALQRAGAGRDREVTGA